MKNVLRPDLVQGCYLGRIRDLVAENMLECINFDSGVLCTGVALDSRQVFGGDLYIALQGAKSHGMEFIVEVLEASPAAVVTDKEGVDYIVEFGLEILVPVLVVRDLRSMLGGIADAVYGVKQRLVGGNVSLFGVTGTNGKTTTSYFIDSIFRSLNQKTGIVGTIATVIDNVAVSNSFTTPEAPDLQGIFALMCEREVKNILMEVSSHAIEYSRIKNTKFNVSGFTNLSQDHLDLHESMESYFKTKAKLFDKEYSDKGVVVIDSKWGRLLANENNTIPITTIYDITNKKDNIYNADWVVSKKESTAKSSKFSLSDKKGNVLNIICGIPGDFNITNAALAIVMVIESGVSIEDMKQIILENSHIFSISIPGRMEEICSRPRTIVDFAHNPDAMRQALSSIKPNKGRLIVVFGATGERDAGKREVMAKISVEESDVVIVTDDDPHDEPAENIRKELFDAALDYKNKLQKSVEILEIYPRKTAIVKAISIANIDDTILIAGRGHQKLQEVKGINLELDDREEARKALYLNEFRFVE